MQNEILKPVLASDTTPVPRYDIINASGVVVQHNVQLQLQNEVEQAGTPYDQDSVLPTQLQQELGLPNSATPADAFRAVLAKAQPAVGDIKQTYRTDLGEDWALCNGDMFDPDEYPDLAKVTPDMLTFASTPYYISERTLSGSIFGVKKIGEYIMCLTYDATAKYLCIHYSNDKFDTWQTVSAVSSSDSISNAQVYYVKGVWYILYTKSNRVYLHYCKDAFVTGTWSSAVTAASGYGTVLNMWYNEATQQYMIACSGYGSGTSSGTNHYPCLITSANDTFSNPVVTKLHDKSGDYQTCIVTDTRYVFVGYDSSAIYLVHGALAYPTNASFVQSPASTSPASASSVSSYSASYTNGKLCVSLYRAVRVFNSLDDFSDYVDVVLPSALIDSHASMTNAKIIYAKEKYITFAQIGNGSSAYLYLWAFDPETEESDFVNLRLVKDDSGNALLPTSYTSTYSGTFEEVFDNCFLIWVSYSQLYRVPLYMLPISNSAPLYTYMKVK